MSRLPDEFTELYVVDPRFRFLGTVPLDRLLRSKRPTKIEDIIGEAKHSVQATDDQEDVARLFERYNLLSVGVVDEAGRLVGVITIDDIVDIIEEEADEDIKRLAGVGDEEISEGVFSDRPAQELLAARQPRHRLPVRFRDQPVRGRRSSGSPSSPCCSRSSPGSAATPARRR